MTKNIQTEIDDKLYRLLKEATEARRMTIKEGIREAVRSWVTEEASIEDDPFFRLLLLRGIAWAGRRANVSEYDVWSRVSLSPSFPSDSQPKK